MIFYFLISIVFIAEIIIAGFLLINLAKLSKIFRQTDIFIQEANPKIKEIMEIGTKISEQMPVLAFFYVDKIKMFSMKILLDNLKGVLAGFLFISFRKKIKVKRIRKIINIIRMLSFE